MFNKNLKIIFLSVSFVCVPALTIFIMSGMAEGFTKVILASILFTIGIGVALFKRARQLAGGILVLGILTLFAFLSSMYSYSKDVKFTTQVLSELSQNTHTFYGFAEKDDVSSSGGFFVKISAVDGKKLKHSISAYAQNRTGHFLHEGAQLKIRARLRQPERQNLQFDVCKWLYGKGVYCEMYDITDFETDYTLDTVSVGSGLRNFAAEKVSHVLNYIEDKDSFEKSVALCKALIFGDKSGFDKASLDNFSKSGITHLLCVSGLHFSLFTGWIMVFLCLVIPKKNIRISVVVILAFLYLAMCGFSYSAMRAAAMAVISGIAVATGKRHLCTHSLLLAVTLICIISPSSVYDMGFRLSVLSCAGIVCASFLVDIFTDSLSENKILSGIVKCFIFSISSFFFTFAYLACATGGISLVSPVTSVFAVFPAQICMVLAWLCLPFAFIKIDVLRFALAKAISLLSDYLYSVADYFANLKFSYMEIDFPDLSLAVFMFLIFAISFAVASRARAAKVYFYVSLSSLIPVIIMLCRF